MGQEVERDLVTEGLFDDGTWAGFLLWDSAMHLSNELITNQALSELVKGFVTTLDPNPRPWTLTLTLDPNFIVH